MRLASFLLVAFIAAQASAADPVIGNSSAKWNPESYTHCGGDVPAFPGAEGYGAEKTCGGRGGQILQVTSLDDNGSDSNPPAGSLRAALAAHNQQTGPSIIVFRVGGTIVARANLRVRRPNLTIAGQTAPGDGIMIRGPATDGYENGCSDPECYLSGPEKDGRFVVFLISASNVIVRHLRIRPGNDPFWVCDDDRDNDGICWGDAPKTSSCIRAVNAAYDDTYYDNCPQAQNGPLGGTCTAWGLPVIGSACQSDGDCASGKTCSKNQEDSDGDGIGDACDIYHSRQKPDSLDRKLYPMDDHPLCYNGYTNQDALTIFQENESLRNIILDHMSLSWSTDETLGIWSPPGYQVSDVIVQYSIISEGLSEGHKEAAYLDTDGRQWGDHGSGMLTSPRSRNISYHHNVIAQNQDRCPGAPASGAHEAVNNVIVNCGAYFQNRRNDRKTIVANISHNLFLPGFRRRAEPGVDWYSGAGVGMLNPRGWRHYYLFLEDNIGVKRLLASDPESAIANPTGQTTTAPRSLPKTPVTATRLGSYGAGTGAFLAGLLAEVGARPDRRDSVDSRLALQIQATHDECMGATQPEGCVYDGVKDPLDIRYGYSPRYGGLINNQAQAGVGGFPVLASGSSPPDSDADGMPDSWETQYGLNPLDASDGPLDADGDIYTNVEEYLNGTHPRVAQTSADGASLRGSGSGPGVDPLPRESLTPH